MPDPFQFADDVGPARIIHIHRAAVGLKAIVVVDNAVCGQPLAACAWRSMSLSKSASTWRGDVRERRRWPAARRRKVRDLR
jgi:hypothetical protein